jgi:hypothetical protein
MGTQLDYFRTYRNMPIIVNTSGFWEAECIG